MDMEKNINMLCDKDRSSTIQNFQELLALSEKENTLYPYFDNFLSMTQSERYLVRLKGFRLLCKQACWDIDNKINEFIDTILLAINDEKPTAVRQKIQALEDIVR